MKHLKTFETFVPKKVAERENTEAGKKAKHQHQLEIWATQIIVSFEEYLSQGGFRITKTQIKAAVEGYELNVADTKIVFDIVYNHF